MPVPQRRAILQNIKTTLEGITTGADFNLTVSLVETLLRIYDEIALSDKPWLGILPEIERAEFLPAGQIRMVLPVQVLGYIEGDGVDQAAIQEDTLDQINELHDDVIVAMVADQGRGGNAVSTTLVDDETNEDEEGSQGVLRMLWEITYFRGC